MVLQTGSRRLTNHVFSLDAKMSRRCQQMCVIGINNAEARLGRRRQVNGIRCAQKHSPRQLLKDVSDAQENFLALREPLERSRLDVRSDLAEQGRIGGGSDCAFAQFAMERSHHFCLAMGCRGHVVCRCERANRVGTGILVIQTDEIARIEVDHSIS